MLLQPRSVLVRNIEYLPIVNKDVLGLVFFYARQRAVAVRHFLAAMLGGRLVTCSAHLSLILPVHVWSAANIVTALSPNNTKKLRMVFNLTISFSSQL